MFSVNFVMFAFADSLMTALKMSSVIDAFKWFPYQLLNKEYLTTLFKITSYQLISAHFGENHMILLQTVT